MKLKQFLLSLLVLLVNITAQAAGQEYIFTDNVLYYSILYPSQDHKVTVTCMTYLNTLYGDIIPNDYFTYSGYWDDSGDSEVYEYCYFSDYTGNISIPQTVNYQGTTYQVTEIRDYAFNNCNPTSITIPNTITKMGKDVFRGYSGALIINCSTLLYTETVYDDDNNPWYEKPIYPYRYGDFTSVTLGNNITTIPENTFWDCSNMSSIVIPQSVTSIGSYAFHGCSGLTSVTIPNSVTTIGNYAFCGCNNLTSVKVASETPVTISSSVFSNRANATLYVPVGSKTKYQSANYWKEFKEIKEIIYFADDNVKTICLANWDTNSDGELSKEEAAAVTDLGDAFRSNAFGSCNKLTSISIPCNVGSIGSYAFFGCTKLTKAEFSSVESICGIYFNGNYSNPLFLAKHLYINGAEVANLIIPSNVTSIGQYAFAGCDGLATVSIGNNVTSIGHHAFAGCDGLATVSIGNNVATIGGEAFANCINLNSVTIPNSVTSIENEAFAGCSGLSSIYFGNGLTSIGYGAWTDCTNINNIYISDIAAWLNISGPLPNRLYNTHIYLNNEEITNLIIPYGVKSIGDGFNGCSSLTSVTIPSSVTSIGWNAFYCCPNLVTVVVDIKIPLSDLDVNSFSNRRNATLYVPYGSKAAYEATYNWQDFKDIIEFIEGDVNSDYETDVVDVVDIARFVVGTPAETFVEILADINRDGGVNIGDAVALVNEIAGDQNFVKELHTSRKSATSANEDMLTLEETDNGIALVLMNQRDYTAFQFDLYVPEETDVAQMLLNSQRKQKHQLLYNKVEEGHYRVVALSTSNRTFMGNSGELLSFALNSVSDGDIAVRNILFYDVEGDGYTFDDLLYGGTATEIADTQSAIPTDGKYHTIDGRLIGDKPTTKGIYIVNGKKVMVK